MNRKYYLGDKSSEWEHMGLEEYEIIIIAAIAVTLAVAIVILVKRCRKTKRVKEELRTVSTIQSAYFSPAEPVHYSTSLNHVSSTAPGWNLTDLDQRTSGVNIQHPAAGAFIVPREPVVFSQSGYPPYPVHEPRTMQEQGYGKPPPYNPRFQYPPAAP